MDHFDVYSAKTSEWANNSILHSEDQYQQNKKRTTLWVQCNIYFKFVSMDLLEYAEKYLINLYKNNGGEHLQSHN